MNRSSVLPLFSAALLLALASNQSAAQTGQGTALSKSNAARRPHVGSPVRTVAWKDLPRGKTDGKSEKPAAINSSWSALGALVIVVGLILVLARLLRRHTPMFSQSLPTDALEILGRRVVDPRQAILLVRIGSRILVVGSSPSGLNALGQIDDAVEVDVLAGLCRRGPQAGILGSSFFKLLKGDAAAQPAPSARQTTPRAPITESPLTGTLESPGERASHPEYDLMRRLRKPAANVPTGGREDLR
jgi:flagellar biogenesis protein FliO